MTSLPDCCQCASTQPEDPSLAVNQSVRSTSTAEDNPLLKTTDAYVNLKNKQIPPSPHHPPMNTEPQTSYLLVF